jgi:hypothetical protein
VSVVGLDPSTGATWRKRSFFTDDNASILRSKRLVVLNGIDPEVTGGDLAEHLARFNLVPIAKRLSDEEIEEGSTDRVVFLCVRQVVPDSGGRPQGDPPGIATVERYRVAPLTN